MITKKTFCKYFASLLLVMFFTVTIFNCRKKNGNPQNEQNQGTRNTNGQNDDEDKDEKELIDLSKLSRDEKSLISGLGITVGDKTTKGVFVENIKSTLNNLKTSKFETTDSKLDWIEFANNTAKAEVKEALGLDDKTIKDIKKETTEINVKDELQKFKTTNKGKIIVAQLNYAGIQNNPFEFINMNDDEKNNSILHEIEYGLDKPLNEIFTKDELNSLGLSDKEQELKLKKFLEEDGYNSFGGIDKTTRSLKIDRYSLILNKKLDINIEDIFSKWDKQFNDDLKKRIKDNAKNNKRKKFASDEEFNKALLGLKIFDLAIIKIIAKAGLLVEANKIRNEFYENSLGNTEKKAEFLFQKLKDVNIICIQESSKELNDKFKTDEYYRFGEDKGSVVFVKKTDFEQIGSDTIEDLSDKHKKKEVAIIKIQHTTTTKKKKNYIIVSAHADGKGEFSQTIIKNVMAKLNDEEKKHGIIFCFDANTSFNAKSIQKNDKADAVKFKAEAETNGLEDTLDDKPTTFKERTFAQTQFKKAGEPAFDKSDWVLSNLKRAGDPYKIFPGPSKDNPTDHIISFVPFDFK